MTPAPQPQTYKRVEIYSLVRDVDGSISRVPKCLCELCRVNHFLCPMYASHSNAKSGDKVLEELQQFREKEFSRIPFDPWLFLNNENKFIVELRQRGERERG